MYETRKRYTIGIKRYETQIIGMKPRIEGMKLEEKAQDLSENMRNWLGGEWWVGIGRGVSEVLPRGIPRIF